ncbi:universal stress protein [Natronorubrum texcoconense]|uniref:Nucleotide-binding universal stress protein, UspA family n=1 Tax=Natronorubrum texcoconense TaxID=1095776 RepID=A0A1G9F8I7_9EURY|nr:universal stress protein [Natronorubrum texcoconense]SDK84660.1 Nucleotide-binding universal stress protein, UspA family [Natronorubrum texcoconense]
MFDTVVIATDGSDSVKRAVDVALDLANRFDAEVHALSVVDASEVDASPQQLRDELQTALETTADAALATVENRTADGREIITAVREGRPAVELCEYAREVDADLIATGTRGRHGENRLLLGSVAERVVRTSPVPVLSVRQLETVRDADANGEEVTTEA